MTADCCWTARGAGTKASTELSPTRRKSAATFIILTAGVSVCGGMRGGGWGSGQQGDLRNSDAASIRHWAPSRSTGRDPKHAGALRWPFVCAAARDVDLGQVSIWGDVGTTARRDGCRGDPSAFVAPAASIDAPHAPRPIEGRTGSSRWVHCIMGHGPWSVNRALGPVWLGMSNPVVALFGRV